MPSILLAIVIICLLAALLIYGFKPYGYGGSERRFEKAGKTSYNRRKLSDTKWSSVEIQPGKISCKRVAALTGQVFLAQDAPSLPLENCSVRNCSCYYKFLDDRRRDADRRIELGQAGEFLPAYGSERRWVAGRRVADQAA